MRHFFREPVDPTQPEGALRLDRVVEPHGDRIEVDYDLVGRVSSVREVLRGERAVRKLDVRYLRVDGYDRLASIESNLGHRVEYGYDARGNLISVTRFGRNVDGGPDADDGDRGVRVHDRHRARSAPDDGWRWGRTATARSTRTTGKATPSRASRSRSPGSRQQGRAGPPA